MKLLQIKDYLLLIDEKAKIKVGDFITDTHIVWQWKDDSSLLGRKLVIAYYPLNSEAKELDLPLLPNPFGEDDAEKEFNRRYKNFIFDDVWDETLTKHGFIEGYKTAQSKQFSLEDVRKAIKMATYINPSNTNRFYTEEEIIQSLSTKKMPSEFIPEYDIIHTDHAPNGFEKLLKFKINSEGKKEIQGIYKY